MLRIYDDALAAVRAIGPLAEAIEGRDRDLARQLRRSCSSMVLNLAEGGGHRAGTRRQRYFDALGSARETLANLECSEALGYIGPVDEALRARFRAVIGTLVVCTRRR